MHLSQKRQDKCLILYLLVAAIQRASALFLPPLVTGTFCFPLSFGLLFYEHHFAIAVVTFYCKLVGLQQQKFIIVQTYRPEALSGSRWTKDQSVSWVVFLVEALGGNPFP